MFTVQNIWIHTGSNRYVIPHNNKIKKIKLNTKNSNNGTYGSPHLYINVVIVKNVL